MMKFITAGLALASLTACASLPGSPGGADATAKLLENLRHCERNYIGSLGGLAPPNASVSIRCPAEPYAKPGEPSDPAE